MTEFFDLIIQNGTVMTPAGRQQIDVGVLAGRIQNLGHFKASRAAEVIDATGLHVLPGVIDSQAHFREPGPEHKEDLESGTRPARESGIACERGAHYHERPALHGVQTHQSNTGNYHNEYGRQRRRYLAGWRAGPLARGQNACPDPYPALRHGRL